jgi:hypothetical protein
MTTGNIELMKAVSVYCDKGSRSTLDGLAKDIVERVASKLFLCQQVF